MKLIAQAVENKVQIENDQLGPPGVRGEIHFVAQIPGESRADHARVKDTEQREFKVFARLSKLPISKDNITARFDENDGNSYMTMPPGAAFQKAETSFGTFKIKGNALGELSLIEFDCTASSATDARHKFQNATLPFLDHIAFIINSPLFVTAIRMEDLKNHTVTIDYISPHRTATVNAHKQNLFIEMKPVYAMYREALSASSDFYKFLCYYKILEGLLGKNRANVYKQAREAGKPMPQLEELVPSSEHLLPIYQPYVGKPIKAFFDSVLTDEFRNAIAHFSTDEGLVLDMSSPAHIDQYAHVIFVCELCARVVIKNHERLLASLHT